MILLWYFDLDFVKLVKTVRQLMCLVPAKSVLRILLSFITHFRWGWWISIASLILVISIIHTNWLIGFTDWPRSRHTLWLCTIQFNQIKQWNSYVLLDCCVFFRSANQICAIVYVSDLRSQFILTHAKSRTVWLSSWFYACLNVDGRFFLYTTTRFAYTV